MRKGFGALGFFCFLLVITVNSALSDECEKVRFFSTKLADSKYLKCSPADEVIFDFEVPDGVTGRAVGKVTMDIQNTSTRDIYFWNLGVYVGEPVYSYRLGDDVCPGETVRTKQNLGYGQLTDARRRVIVKGFQGSGSCIEDRMKIMRDAQLTIWVEDPAPECVGSTIRYASFYSRSKPSESLSWWHWPHNMTTVVSEELHIRPQDQGIIAVTAVEGSPWVNPNRSCGVQGSTLAAQIWIDGAIKRTKIAQVPASLGMGHLTFGMYFSGPFDEGKHRVELKLGRNFGGYDNTSRDPSKIVTSGGCCGDAALAIIRY